MLLQRIHTAVVLVAIVLAAVFKLPPDGFGVFLLLVISVAIWEWTALAGLTNLASRAAYLLALVVMIAAVEAFSIPLLYILLPGLLFWVLAVFAVVSFPRTQSIWGRTAVLMMLGLVLFIPAFAGFRHLRNQDFYIFHLLFLPGLVAAADIGAYFSGRTFGKHKLAVKVSPNKTWEGVAGGTISSMAVMLVTGWVLISQKVELSLSSYFLLGLSALVITAFSVLGDLFESMVKRFRDVKDSGRILPGHGGMLDRIDALVAAIPLYAFLLVQLEKVIA